MREEIIREMKGLVSERTGAEVTVHNVTKNNGTELVGISIKETGKRIAPIVYIDNIIAGIEYGDITMQDAVENIERMYKENKYIIPGVCDSFQLDKEFILQRVECRLVNRELNEKILDNVPHKDFLDLAVTYVVVVSRDVDGVASFQVKNEMLELYGINVEELEDAAIKNTYDIGFTKMSMVEIMKGMPGYDMGMTEEDNLEYVLTNESGVNGANVMLYSQLFDEIVEEYNSDLYILPSSIHEVIVIPANEDRSLKKLKIIVKSLNNKVVSEQEILSRSVYKYSKENKEVSIAA